MDEPKKFRSGKWINKLPSFFLILSSIYRYRFSFVNSVVFWFLICMRVQLSSIRGFMTSLSYLVSKLGTIEWVAYLAKYMKTIDKYSTHDADADADADLSCIYSCMFGLGFYSTYMVADKVVVTTKKKGHDPYVWEFDANANENGGSTFSVVAAARGGDTFNWGTKVTLHLKEDHHEYLKVHKLQESVNKYPMEMGFYPIFILDENKKPIQEEQKVKEEEEEPLEVLEERYKGIRDLFVEHIRGMAKNVDVVITDRVAEVFCNQRSIESVI